MLGAMLHLGTRDTKIRYKKTDMQTTVQWWVMSVVIGTWRKTCEDLGKRQVNFILGADW